MPALQEAIRRMFYCNATGPGWIGALKVVWGVRDRRQVSFGIKCFCHDKIDIINPESILGRRHLHLVQVQVRTLTDADKKQKSALLCVDQRPKQGCKKKPASNINFGGELCFSSTDISHANG
jgi:hypothetical protein